MAPVVKLVYHSGRGRAEGARLLLAAGGIEYENVRLTPEQWAKEKPSELYFFTMISLDMILYV